MKKILLMFLLAAAPVFAQAGFDPIGKWEATDTDGGTIYITFDAEGYVSIEKDDEIIGGKHFELDGKQGQMTYTFIAGTNHVDLIMKDLQSGDEKKLFGIYMPEGKDEMTLSIDNMRRPDGFEEGIAMLFKRVTP